MADRFIQFPGGRVRVAALLFLALIGLVLPVSALNLSATQYTGNTPAGGTANYAIIAGIPWDTEPVDLLVDVVGISQKPDLSYVAVEPIKDTYAFSGRKYVSVDKESIHLEPGIKQQFTLSFNLPANTGDNSRYAMVVVHTIAAKTGNATDITIPVLLTPIGSSPSMSGSITSFDAGNAILGQKAAFATSYRNTGTTHQNNLVNTITVSGPDGGLLVTESGEPLSTPLLPEKSYEFRVVPDTSRLMAGNYTVLSKITLGNGQVMDKKTTILTINGNTKTPVPAAPTANTPAVPTTAKSSLPAVLGLAALAGALVIISSRR
ncbi:MAG: hypothetical protein WC586_05810 [Methanoregula sp.]